MLKIKNILSLGLILFSITLTQAQIKVGDKLPSIALKSNNNKTVKLDSFKGKTVLVDFWASWCAPCRVGNKSLVKLYEKYKGQNFEIVSISIDTDEAKWLRAIEKDKMKHTQLIDPKGFKAPSAISFGVEALPAVYLFDDSGKLISINPTEKQIITQIQKKN